MADTYRKATPEEIAAAEAAEAEWPQIQDNLAEIEAAAREQSFSGQLRRAIHGIHKRRIPLTVFLRESGLSLDRMGSFLAGREMLTGEEIDRVVGALKLTLVAEDSTP